MTLLIALGVVLTGLTLAVVFGAPHLERALMYAPDPTHTSPAAAGLPRFEERVLATPDGQRIVTWRAKAGPARPTLIYVHGNAGTLADRSDRLAAYHARGVGIAIMAYRGYSGSTGKPSEANNVADARQLYDALIADGVAAEDIIVYGESIGTGIAVQLAASRKVAGLVLDAPYTSIVDVAELYYPYLPARALMRDRYETLRHLKKMRAPMLVIHGERDLVIPVEMGRKVAAAGGAEIVTFPEAGHSDHGKHGSFEAVMRWIERLRAGRSTSLVVDRAAG
ncbi:MAG: alpha/beta hydrolase [Hyphomicrobiaceae bacterium]|nr:alpha/beta hydrolase [Hyphomicrobiaceae bacterium]